MADEKMIELFKRYKATGDVALRNQIVEHYLYIADIIAKKFIGRGVEYDDLVQVARLALINGVDRFDPDLGLKFTTFITPTIMGEIKNYFRDKSRTIKIPRRLSELSMAVKKFSAQYEVDNGEKPSVRMIAKSLQVSEEEVIKALEVGGTVSLDGAARGEDGENERSLHALLADDEDAYDRFEIKETLRAATADFSETEKKILKYRFTDGLSQSDTAARLGVSQMFISRMERKILAKLRTNLKDTF